MKYKKVVFDIGTLGFVMWSPEKVTLIKKS